MTYWGAGRLGSKNIANMEITGENTVAAPWMEHGQHIQLPSHHTI